MFCPKCGAKNNQSNFCCKCGIKLREEIASHNVQNSKISSFKKYAVIGCVLIIIVVTFFVVKAFREEEDIESPEVVVKQMFKGILTENVDLFLQSHSDFTKEKLREDLRCNNQQELKKFIKDKLILVWKQNYNTLGVYDISDINIKVPKNYNKIKATLDVTLGDKNYEVVVVKQDGHWFVEYIPGIYRTFPGYLIYNLY